jgi:23S rRNA (uracil1939-C5)-methyltransferase
MSQTVRFETVVPEGKALSKEHGKATFCIGPLPGELAEVSISKQKRHYNEAVLRRIIEPSAHRHGEGEDHALSCSPWQDVDYGYQIELKTAMLKEAFKQHRQEVEPSEFVKAPEQFGYRNRLDFTVAQIEGRWQLGFHRRGSWRELLPLPNGCKLASLAMNQAALDLIDKLNHLHVPMQSAMLTVRQSFTTKQILLILTTDLANFDWPTLDSELGTLLVARPLPGSGAPGELAYSQGPPELTEELAGLNIAYPYDSFFQTNIPVFREALNRIITAAANSTKAVELYSGVGSIGLPLAKTAKAVHGVEIVTSSVDYARRNAIRNQLGNYFEVTAAAEKADLSILSEADTVVVDPPRAGLHSRVTRQLIEKHPAKIIYLSCNPITQARDLQMLSPNYSIENLTAFDFYPGTLHLESLAILERH